MPPLLTRLGIRTELLMQDIEREIARLPKVQGFGQQHMSRALNDVLERSFKEATKFQGRVCFHRASCFWPSPGKIAIPRGAC